MTHRPDLDAVVARVWARARSATQVRLSAVIDAWQRWPDDLEDEERRAATQDAHRLAGALGSYGFPDGSEILAEVEDLLPLRDAPPGRPADEVLRQLRSLQDRIGRAG